jgi:hypothetical protein
MSISHHNKLQKFDRENLGIQNLMFRIPFGYVQDPSG